MCGEKLGSFFLLRCCTGSPPRVRGKALLEKLLFRLCRITPARAGKSLFVSWDFCFIWDHPRACGEKWPRLGCGQWRVGITPARAGKSMMWPCRRPMTRDHPRACGEKPPTCRNSCLSLGSPPRMRGKVHVCHCSLIRRRITPAYAGKSDKHQRARSWLGDYPRVCGEKALNPPWVW